ncbi:MAG: hypothetical protein AAF771_01150 [Pseudomonadota bacterium]
MQAIMRRFPSSDDLQRNKGKLAGFAAGVIVPLIIVALFQVAYTGYGLSEDPTPATVIYPNF